VLPVYVIYKTKQPTSGSPAFWPAQHILISAPRIEKLLHIMSYIDTYTQKYVDLFLFTVLSKFHFAGWEKKNNKKTTTDSSKISFKKAIDL
jgi:hypothetical protein